MKKIGPYNAEYPQIQNVEGESVQFVDGTIVCLMLRGDDEHMLLKPSVLLVKKTPTGSEIHSIGFDPIHMSTIPEVYMIYSRFPLQNPHNDERRELALSEHAAKTAMLMIGVRDLCIDFSLLVGHAPTLTTTRPQEAMAEFILAGFGA